MESSGLSARGVTSGTSFSNSATCETCSPAETDGIVDGTAMHASILDDFVRAASHDSGLARAALCFARIEYPDLDPAPYLARLDEMGRVARDRLAGIGAPDRTHASRVLTLTQYIYEDLGFTGDREHYDDPRNSFLNVVLDRRAGIPITLAVVLLEVSARAGLRIEGINFPGHFLVRAPVSTDDPHGRDLLIDPFHGGAIVSESDCYRLLRTHLGDAATLSPGMFAVAGKHQILVRMLLNLKRAYVRMRSFPQARDATELLLALDPSALTELRDRGLLAYHLEDFSSALRDLQSYLRLAAAPSDDEERQEHDQIWEHVKALKRRIASFN
jgi:regulator of sirC expression with transglutaminase-like and TPR domain